MSVAIVKVNRIVATAKASLRILMHVSLFLDGQVPSTRKGEITTFKYTFVKIHIAVVCY